MTQKEKAKELIETFNWNVEYAIKCVNEIIKAYEVVTSCDGDFGKFEWEEVLQELIEEAKKIEDWQNSSGVHQKN